MIKRFVSYNKNYKGKFKDYYLVSNVIIYKNLIGKKYIS